MNNNLNPIPLNEINRLINLSQYDIDYLELKENFIGLTTLAAKVTGTAISVVNLIDAYTQWTVSGHGWPIGQVPRENSVCQYTIMEDDCFEIPDLSKDERFKNDFDKEGDLKYYYGIPLKTKEGYNIGSLCVLDKDVRLIEPEKKEILKIIAEEVINRLNTIKIIESLKGKAIKSEDDKIKVAHDIRGPLSGIVGLAKCISDQGDSNTLEDILQFITMIQKSGSSILELADEILNEEKRANHTSKTINENEFNLVTFKNKLEKLYKPQAVNKKISFAINLNADCEEIVFPKNKLVQIIGNLISNAIKFTAIEGKVTVDLNIIAGKTNTLHIKVIDTGEGLDQQTICNLLNGNAPSTMGTCNEKGYGFGLEMVKHLIETLKGTMHIHSIAGEGSTFEVFLPQV